MKRLFVLFLLWASSLCWGADPLSEVLTAPAAVLMDYDTGRLLYERDPDRSIPPASMAKVMTLYLAYDDLREGVISKEQLITVDEAGSSFSRPPRSSLMLLEEGQRLSFLDLMKGLAVASGNDAAYALADLLGPGVPAFVARMNRKAAELGLEETVFVDPDGWSENNLVTPGEYARLARSYIREYPQALEELHSQLFLLYPLPENLPEGRDFRIRAARKKRNTNRLLGRYEGIDGLKTGYIDEAGFNFTGTARRGDTRLIAVVMGIRRESYYRGLLARAEEAAALLDYGFGEFSRRPLEAPALPELTVRFGQIRGLTPQLKGGAAALLAEAEAGAVYSVTDLPAEMTAPFPADRVIGKVRYYIGGDLLAEAEIIPGRDVARGNLFQRLRDHLILWWRGLGV